MLVVLWSADRALSGPFGSGSRFAQLPFRGSMVTVRTSRTFAGARAHHELRRVGAVGNDVDLLAARRVMLGGYMQRTASDLLRRVVGDAVPLPVVREDGRVGPAVPLGRRVRLAGRGTTFVREIAGPPGAPTLVLLHGFMASGGLNWFRTFDGLSREFRVVAPDLRGHARGIRSRRRMQSR
jgi:hypothetical protein